MKTEYTALIVPAMTDQAGQCRIVVKPGTAIRALDDYRRNPDTWKEVGLMNSQGKLVCCEELGNLREELASCEPLMAGLAVSFSCEAQGVTWKLPQNWRPGQFHHLHRFIVVAVHSALAVEGHYSAAEANRARETLANHNRVHGHPDTFEVQALPQQLHNVAPERWAAALPS